ncbi:MAG: hypothetical protein ACYC23_07210 [Limisphaerales bacterium]
MQKPKAGQAISFRPSGRNMEILKRIEALTMASPSRIADEALTIGLPVVAARLLANFDNSPIRDSLQQFLSEINQASAVNSESPRPSVADIVEQGAMEALGGRPGNSRKGASEPAQVDAPSHPPKRSVPGSKAHSLH